MKRHRSEQRSYRAGSVQGGGGLGTLEHGDQRFRRQGRCELSECPLRCAGHADQAFDATAGSLYYSEVAGYIPCEYWTENFNCDMDFGRNTMAYRDFCVYRVTEAQNSGKELADTDGPEWLEHRRRQLHLRKHLSRKHGQP